MPTTTVTVRVTTLNEALEDYYSMRLGDLSPATRDAHTGQLERFRKWITQETQPNVYLTDIDDRMIRRYFDRLRPPAYAASSYNNYRQYLNAFWEFCRRESWITTNPMRHVDPLRVPRRRKTQLSAVELLDLLEQTEDPRDRVALALGMNTGLRGGDIATLTVGAVNLTNDVLTAWIEKTDSEITLPITAELRVELIRWFQAYAEATGLPRWQDVPNEWTLIPPARGAAFNVHDPSQGFRRVYKTNSRYTHPEKIVHRAMGRLGLPTHREGFHTLRRSAAREIYEEAKRRKMGDPIAIAQALLDHKSRRTTELYLDITHEKELLDEMMRGQSFLTRAVHRTETVETLGEDRRSA